MTNLTEVARAKVLGKMLGWASVGGCWNTPVPFVRRIHDTEVAIYEVKSHQERLFFIRCGDDAVALMGFSKKGTAWGKKEKSILEAAMSLFREAVAECADGPTIT